jgi:hypothetical protein
MDIGNLIGDVLKAARTATAIIPGMQGASAIISVGEQLVGIIDGLSPHAPDTRTQAEMQAIRAALAARVSKKAEDTANRLDG